nr:MAG: hypothetical protein [Trichoderma atroviride partitivirus 1]
MQSRSFNSFFLFLSYIRKKVRMCEKITKNSKIKKGISGRNSNLLNLKKISKPVPLVSSGLLLSEFGLNLRFPAFEHGLSDSSIIVVECHSPFFIHPVRSTEKDACITNSASYVSVVILSCVRNWH